MDRIFHARVTFVNYVALFLIGGMTLWALWDKHVLIALALVLLLIVCIEKLIHTTYTLTDDKMVLYYGRFIKSKEVPLAEVKQIRGYKSMLNHGVLIDYSENKFVLLQPVKEEEFVQILMKRTKQTDK